MTPHTDPPTGATPPRMLLGAVARLLRPLVRVLIRFGVTYPQLARMLKTVYVTVARDHFPTPDGKQTDSRISVLTGVHRKDVRRLRDAPADDFALPESASLAAQIIGVWLGVPEYQDATGAPRALPRRATAGDPGPDFEKLVESVTKDVRPRTLLDEWQARGIVTLDADNRVRLLRDAFVPDESLDELAYYFGRNLHEHIAAAGRNLTREAEPLLERSVHYTRLTPQSAERLRKLATRTGMTALMRVNAKALELAEADRDKPDATRRISFGVYFNEADRSGDDEDDAE